MADHPEFDTPRADDRAPFGLVRSVYQNRHLIRQLVKREVAGRYRGSVLGLFWSFFNPLFMLAIYTFVFSVVFQTRWEAGNGSRTEFAMILFSGLIVFNMFSETVTRAPGLVIANVSYVKKVVFPLEVLPVVTVLSTAFHGLISVGVLLAFRLVAGGGLSPMVLLFPLVVAPLLVLSLGIALFLAALGVYLRDVSQTIQLLMTALMFVSPIFFPVTALPERLRPFMLLNPLTFALEQARNVLIFARAPDWPGLLLYTAVSALVVLLGYVWFQRVRKGFSDVI